MDHRMVKAPLQRIIVFVLYALPIISLAIAAMNLLKFGIDMPIYDDWREYKLNGMGSFELGYLFRPANDTLYPFGLLLDSIVFKIFDGNSIAYQLISFIVVQGGIVFAIFKLIKKCEINEINRSLGFCSSLLILQPDTYWGYANLAFHQAIPVLCILISIYVFLSDVKWKTSIFIISALCAGLSYTSGAFSIFAVGIVLVLIKYIFPSSYSATSYKECLGLLIPGLLTSLAQLWVIVGIQHGTHRADAPMAFPWESDFWLFMLGKISRSLLLPTSMPAISLLLTCIAVIIFVSITINCFVRLYSDKTNFGYLLSNQFAVLIALAAAVFVYLLLVSAGRANMRPEDANAPLEIFLSGYPRFHFYWVSLLWPFLLISLFSYIKNHQLHKLLIIAICFYFALNLGKIFDHESVFKNGQQLRLEGVQCVQDALDSSQEKIVCPTLLPGQDLKPMLINARKANASFMHYFPFRPVNVNVKTASELFRLSDDYSRIQFHNASNIGVDGSKRALDLETTEDSNAFISIDGDLIGKCNVLEVDVELDNKKPKEYSQLFYLPNGAATYSETDSQVVSLNEFGKQQIHFMAESESGFKNQLRFDPVSQNNTIMINDIVVRCRDYH